MFDKKQQQRILVFDTETTGLIKGPRPRALEQYPYITQLTAILYSVPDRKIIAVLNEYISLPEGVHIEPVASQITGITDEICQKRGKPIQDVLQVFCEFILTCHILVAHNYDFDCEVLKIALYRCLGQIPSYFNRIIHDDYLQRIHVLPFCTMKNSVEFCDLKTNYGQLKFPRLIELYRALFGLSSIGGKLHNSAVDTWVCLRCFLKIYFQITIPDTEFAEKMNLLINDGINDGKEEEDQQDILVSISSRTRRRFPL